MSNWLDGCTWCGSRKVEAKINTMYEDYYTCEACCDFYVKRLNSFRIWVMDVQHGISSP